MANDQNLILKQAVIIANFLIDIHTLPRLVVPVSHVSSFFTIFF